MLKPKFYRPDVDIRRSDVLISLEKGKDGLHISPRVRLFCKNDKGELERIGLIEELELKASMHTLPVTLKVKYPKPNNDLMVPQVRDAVTRHRQILLDSGVELDTCTCTRSPQGMGVNPDCPVHGTGE